MFYRYIPRRWMDVLINHYQYDLLALVLWGYTLDTSVFPIQKLSLCIKRDYLCHAVCLKLFLKQHNPKNFILQTPRATVVQIFVLCKILSCMSLIEPYCTGLLLWCPNALIWSVNNIISSFKAALDFTGIHLRTAHKSGFLIVDQVFPFPLRHLSLTLARPPSSLLLLFIVVEKRCLGSLLHCCLLPSCFLAYQLYVLCTFLCDLIKASRPAQLLFKMFFLSHSCKSVEIIWNIYRIEFKYMLYICVYKCYR